MKLVSLILENYRRFEKRTTIDLVPSVVAFIGPNEAGKSSILSALEFLNQNHGSIQSVRTRGSHRDVVIKTTFLLDSSDQAALTGVKDGRKIRCYTFECRLEEDSTNFYYSLDPSPHRDLKPRHSLAARLKSLIEAEGILNQFIRINGLTISKAYEDALHCLTSTSDDLTNAQKKTIQGLADALLRFPNIRAVENPTISDNQISTQLADLLQSIREYDEGASPSRQAADILSGRRPRFRLFTDEDRIMQSTYPLDSFTSPPNTLANLARLARLDLAELRDHAGPEHAGRRTTILTRANERLKQQFQGLWPQHDLTVLLNFNHPNLEVTISAPDGDYSVVTERSDGLKSFVALRAFLATQEDSTLPILLVDEAETHLHYDAQANLVDMFARQTLASKVIYTTHSAGCLPMDLGYGIRVVTPTPMTERSSVRKSIWDGQFAGFSPMIFAMGATTFAFLPARNVLLAEGESDAMLLPTLMMESVDRSLPFQIAPGISNSNLEALSRLQSEGGAVLFLVDGDSAGDKLRDDLKAAKVPARNILSLGQHIEPLVMLEDLLDPGYYAQAANEVMSFYCAGSDKVSAADLSSPNRPKQLENWCATHSIKVPSKIAICQQLLDMKAMAMREGRTIALLDPNMRPKLRKLTTRLINRFPQLPTYSN